jgi:hypothetical protein
MNTEVSQGRTDSEQGLLALVAALVLLGAMGMLFILG